MELFEYASSSHTSEMLLILLLILPVGLLLDTHWNAIKYELAKSHMDGEVYVLQFMFLISSMRLNYDFALSYFYLFFVYSSRSIHEQIFSHVILVDVIKYSMKCRL